MKKDPSLSEHLIAISNHARSTGARLDRVEKMLIQAAQRGLNEVDIPEDELTVAVIKMLESKGLKVFPNPDDGTFSVLWHESIAAIKEHQGRGS